MRFRLRRKTKRFFKRLILSSPLFIIGWFLYLLLRSPSSQPAQNITVDLSPARIERGKYLFDAVCACGSCHSERDFKKFGGPLLPGRSGSGQEMPFYGLPGTITAGNLTRDKDSGLGQWTDGEKIRAIRDGINKDGRALYPLMPYQYYRYLSDEDVQSIVAYANWSSSIENLLAAHEHYLSRVHVDQGRAHTGALHPAGRSRWWRSLWRLPDQDRRLRILPYAPQRL